jgi:hypothetical protein
MASPWTTEGHDMSDSIPHNSYIYLTDVVGHCLYSLDNQGVKWQIQFEQFH